jgi:hypothetical protein
VEWVPHPHRKAEWWLLRQRWLAIATGRSVVASADP